jgi:hypothetical protein
LLTKTEEERRGIKFNQERAVLAFIYSPVLHRGDNKIYRLIIKVMGNRRVGGQRTALPVFPTAPLRTGLETFDLTSALQ